jgi:hypothetical protein
VLLNLRSIRRAFPGRADEKGALNGGLNADQLSDACTSFETERIPQFRIPLLR